MELTVAEKLMKSPRAHTPNMDKYGISAHESKEKTWCHYGFYDKASRKGYVLHHIDEDMFGDDRQRHDMYFIEDCIPMSHRSHIIHHNRGCKRIFTDEHRRHIGEKSKGRKHSQEFKNKLRESRKGQNNPCFGRKHTDEEVEKMRANNGGNKPVMQFSKNGTFIAEFRSAAEAARSIGIKPCNIGECIRGTQKTAGGYLWKRKEVI